MASDPSSPGTVTLMGSGELTASMSKVHQSIIARIEGPVRAVFLDTPAGFELNSDNLTQRAVEYVKRYVGVPCAVASFRSASQAGERETRDALRKLEQANYIFAGPGSPTYTVRNWRGTPVFDLMVRRLSEGAHIVLASAAAIAIGRYCLPVYEIYKVGEEPHWSDGLDLLSPYGLEPAIVTHWNNTEGGTYDTRRCFMGESRFQVLESLLPESTVVLGVDEYTACVIDLAANECRVMASSGVTLRLNGEDTVFPSGSSFSLDLLKKRVAPKGESKSAAPRRERAAPPAGDTLLQHLDTVERMLARGDGYAGLADLASDLYDLAREIDEAEAANTSEDIILRGRRVLRQLLASGTSRVDPSSANPVAGIGPFVELLIDLRSRLRAAEEWALADEVRDRLAALGITLEDGPARTAWKSGSPS